MFVSEFHQLGPSQTEEECLSSVVRIGLFETILMTVARSLALTCRAMTA